MVQVGLLRLLIVIDSLKLLLKVLVRHDVVVAAQRLNYLVAVLVHDNGLAQVTATLVGKLVQSDRAVVLARILCRYCRYQAGSLILISYSLQGSLWKCKLTRQPALLPRLRALCFRDRYVLFSNSACRLLCVVASR